MYFLQCTLLSSTFIEFLISFHFSFFQIFECLLSPKSFDSLEGPLAHKQTFLLITFGGLEIISITTIALIPYLGSWAFVVSIVVARFMVDEDPFLFEALA
jgi:hypothetical protein